jgi:hypothetical protein
VRLIRPLAWLIAVGLVVLGALLVIRWYFTPSGLYDAKQYEAQWLTAANGVIAGTAPRPSSLVGVGPIADVQAVRLPDGSRQITFWRVKGVDGVIYSTKESDLPNFQDICVVQVAIHWWQIRSLDSSTKTCPRGYTFIQGP